MPSLPYTLLDVFSDEPLRGNQLAVVHDADAVADETMHAFARETKLSETCFIQAGGEGADYRNRIWMVTHELPFAGHPSLGAAVAVARRRGDARARYVQRTGAGLQPVDVRVDGPRGHASMLQEPATFGPRLDPAEVLGAVGLAAADADPGHPPQVAATGLTHLVAFVAAADALGRCRPDHDAIAALLAPHDATALYVVAADGAAGTARARSFLPTAEMAEDPATGSAAGPLCALLAERTGLTRLTITQGVEMGRPSTLHAALEGDRVRVGGDVVVVADGTVHLP